MDTGSGNAASPVIRDLMSRPQDFRFFTAVRLLERLRPDGSAVGAGHSPLDEPVRFRAGTHLAFPGSDLLGARWTDDKHEQVELMVAFLGLYGIASPLPTYFQEAAAADSAAAVRLRDFLRMFDQRMYAFFYRAWKRNRLPDAYVEQAASREYKLLSAVSGLAAAAESPAVGQRQRLFAAGGLLGTGVRSACGLESTLREYFRVPVRVQQHAPLWRDNPAPPRLGDQARILGRSLAIGSRIRHRAGCFRVTIGPVQVADARDFLPGQPVHHEFREVVRAYAPDYLSYECQLNVLAESSCAVRLGATDTPLGWLSWMGRPSRPAELVPIGRFQA